MRPHVGGGGGIGIQPPGVKICFYLPDVSPGVPSTGAAGQPITAVAKANYRWLPGLGLGISEVGIVSTATGRVEIDSSSGPLKYSVQSQATCNP